MKLHEAWHLVQTRGHEDEAWSEAIEVLYSHASTEKMSAKLRARGYADQQVEEAVQDCMAELIKQTSPLNGTFGNQISLPDDDAVEAYLFQSCRNQVESQRRRASRKEHVKGDEEYHHLEDRWQPGEVLGSSPEGEGEARDKESSLRFIERAFTELCDRYVADLKEQGRQQRVIDKAERLLGFDRKLLAGDCDYEDVMNACCDDADSKAERNRVQKRISRVRSSLLAWTEEAAIDAEELDLHTGANSYPALPDLVERAVTYLQERRKFQ